MFDPKHKFDILEVSKIVYETMRYAYSAKEALHHTMHSLDRMFKVYSVMRCATPTPVYSGWADPYDYMPPKYYGKIDVESLGTYIERHLLDSENKGRNYKEFASVQKCAPVKSVTVEVFNDETFGDYVVVDGNKDYEFSSISAVEKFVQETYGKGFKPNLVWVGDGEPPKLNKLQWSVDDDLIE